MIKNISFGGILGAKKTTNHFQSGLNWSATVQDYYPFKNEFKNKEEEDKFVSRHTTHCSEPPLAAYTLAVKEELPFTKDEFNKMSHREFKEQFLDNHPDIYSITYSEVGLCPHKERLKERGRIL